MDRLTLCIPLVIVEEDKKISASIAIREIDTEMPTTEQIPLSVEIKNSRFVFTPFRILYSFEEKNEAVLLTTDMRCYPGQNEEEISRQVFEALNEDRNWNIIPISPGHLALFLRTFSLPISLGQSRTL